MLGDRHCRRLHQGGNRDLAAAFGISGHSGFVTLGGRSRKKEREEDSLYHGHRFPAAIITCAVRWYFRFNPSLRDIEELPFERGVVITYEAIRRWCDKFGAAFAHCVKAARRKPGSTWHLDEMFVTLRGEFLLWRAVDEHGADLTSCCRSGATRLWLAMTLRVMAAINEYPIGSVVIFYPPPQ